MRKGLGKTALALLLIAGPLGLRLGVAHAQDAPLFDPPRPFDGVPIPSNSPFLFDLEALAAQTPGFSAPAPAPEPPPATTEEGS